MWSLVPWKKNQSGQNGSLTTQPIEREFSRIREDFDNLFQRLWSNFPMVDRSFDLNMPYMGLDINENETHYIARIDAPGFEVNDFDVSVSGNQLIVKAERKESDDGKNGSSYRYGQFYRALPLPDGVEDEQIEASYRNGVLELKIPKGKEAQNVKKIAVKAA
jgi:HSP20 family protein